MQYQCTSDTYAKEVSLLAQERGLQYHLPFLEHAFCLSLLAQERGLQCTYSNGGWQIAHVAPRAGAWVAIAQLSPGRALRASLLAQERGLQ